MANDTVITTRNSLEQGLAKKIDIYAGVENEGRILIVQPNGNFEIDDINMTYTNLNPSTIRVGGVPRGSNFNGLTIQEMFDWIFYPPIPQYTITFITNGGSVVAPITVEEETIITTIPSSTREGHEFQGWYRDEGFTNKQVWTDPVMNNFNLFAKWEILKFNVVFITNGGTSVSPVVADWNSLITQPTTNKEGHDLLGWYLEEGLVNKFVFESTRILEDKALYANWKIREYTVKFEMGDASPLADVTINHGDTLDLPINLTLEDHTFGGWFLDENFTTEFENIPITGNITLWAKWVADTKGAFYFGAYYGTGARQNRNTLAWSNMGTGFNVEFFESTLDKFLKGGNGPITGTAAPSFDIYGEGFINSLTVEEEPTPRPALTLSGVGYLFLMTPFELDNIIVGGLSMFGAFTKAIIKIDGVDHFLYYMDVSPAAGASYNLNFVYK